MTVLLLLAACAKPPPAASTPMPPPATPAGFPEAAAAGTGELSPALAPLAWWLGDWDQRDGKGSESWVAAGGAIYGVALHADGFEVLVVDDGEGPGRPDGVLRLFAMPNGKRMVEFRQRAIDPTAATFGNDEHDFPKTIRYGLTTDRGGMTAVLGGGKQIEFQFARGARTAAPELEAADLAFAAATAERGVDGWVAAFDARGGMMRKSGRIDYAAIGDAMKPVLTSGRLAWAPITSGVRGDLGFTVGKATFTGAKPDDGWRSTYVTIWRRQPDGAWKVLFDTGRVVQDG
jgi:ketosteroid isomerase-like protein